MPTCSSTVTWCSTRVFYASEAGAEAIMAQLADPLEDGALTDVELAVLDPPELEGLFRYGRLVKALRPAPGTVDAR